MKKRLFSDDREIYRWLIVLVEFAFIGVTSFGGGSATVAAMRQLCSRRGWLSEREFVDTLVLSKLTPGISILAQALLIGRAAGGAAGMVAGPVGLLVPSIAITVLLARLYEWVSAIPWAAGPLHSVTAVTAGFAVALSLQFMKDVLNRSRVALNAGIFVIYLALSYVIHNPLLLMGLAIAAALAVPSLFDDAEAGSEDATQDGEASVEP